MMLLDERFLPHGQCLLWDSGLLWLHVISDSLITLSYYSIPLTLLYILKKRDDFQFSWIVGLFGAFIFLCGTTHLIGIITLWSPAYWIEGAVKLLTAAASISTALLLISLSPQILTLPSTTQMESANQALQREVQQHKQTIHHLDQVTQELTVSHQESMQFNSLMVGRESRMIELKEEINRLCIESGKPPVYDLRGIDPGLTGPHLSSI